MARPADSPTLLPPRLADLVARMRARSSTIDVIEKAHRRRAVELATANAVLEGFQPDAEIEILDALYIDGKLTIEEELEYYRNKYQQRIK